VYFLTVDDLDTKPWIADRREATFHGLRTAYEAAWALQHRAGLGFVVGPIRSRDGSVIVRISDRYSAALFPFVDGVPGQWGQPVPHVLRTRLLHELAALHQATDAIDAPIPRRPPDVPERPLLTAALEDLDRRWDAGPLSEPARHSLAYHADAVTGWLVEMDALAGRLQVEPREAVITHGEPHPGNLIQTDLTIRLIDWDTAALAIPERDLWMLDDGSREAFAPYEQETGRTVSDTAVRFYQLAWTLSDIAWLAHLFRMPHRRTQWLEFKWRGFEALLDGTPSAPYGMPILQPPMNPSAREGMPSQGNAEPGLR
jgi:spectinomycin phosphotransferase